MAFFVTGVLVGILFDIFRVTRKAFNTPNFLIYVEDTVFWILTGVLVLITLCTFTNGEIRLYMILMLICGTIIYFATISKYFVLFNTKLLEIVKKVVNFIVLPFKKVIKILEKTLKLKKIPKSDAK